MANEVDVPFPKLARAEQIRLIKQQLGESGDLIVQELKSGSGGTAALVYIEGLVDARTVNEIANHVQNGPLFGEASSAVPASHMSRPHDLGTAVDAVLAGFTLLLCEEDGGSGCIAVDTKGGDKRSIAEPATETVVRGPREGFTEAIRTNTALVRRRLKDSRLRVENMQAGRVSKTDIAILYIHGIADDRVVREVRSRLQSIDIDAVQESGYIEEWIQDRPFSLFPTMINTERPDVVAANLLEGRVAIMVDGSPFVLLAPVVFIQFFQAAEDYYHRFHYSVIRILRIFCFFIALLAPALYVALTTFHQEAIPTPLLISLAAQREGIPFPAFLEAFIMEITFEILREAGVRMPRAIGQAVSIVGALVLGQASVEAGLVSPAMVIVVSITAIAGFVVPAYDMAISIRMLRFVFIVLAATFGLFGISTGIIALVLYLCSLHSFGVPFMAPFAPMSGVEMRDTLVRFPNWMLRLRPRFFSGRNNVRVRSNAARKP